MIVLVDCNLLLLNIRLNTSLDGRFGRIYRARLGVVVQHHSIKPRVVSARVYG